MDQFSFSVPAPVPCPVLAALLCGLGENDPNPSSRTGDDGSNPTAHPPPRGVGLKGGRLKGECEI